MGFCKIFLTFNQTVSFLNPHLTSTSSNKTQYLTEKWLLIKNYEEKERISKNKYLFSLEDYFSINQI